MKTPFIRTFAVLLLVTVATANAQVPQIINYQGRVAVGSPPVNFDGSGAFKFALVDAAGTTTYWSNDNTSVGGGQPTGAVTLPVTKGLYSVLLGANMTAIPNTVFANADVHLRVWFNDGTAGSQLLTPDRRLAAVGYAMMAGDVADGVITTPKIADGAVTSAKLAPGVVQTTNLATGAVGNAQLANPSLTITAGAGLGGGGVVALGETVTLSNTGVRSLAGGGGITVDASTGALTLGSSATSANTASAIVARDASGNFAAGTITATLIGSATSFTGSLAGDVTGTQGATAIAAGTVTGKALTGFVSGAGTITASDTILSAINKLNGTDALKAPLASPTFTGTVTASSFSGNLTGNASTATSATTAGSFTGSLAGDVTGTQGATVVASVGGVSGANVAAGANLANAATTANTPDTIVKRDGSGNIPGVTPASTAPPGMVLIPAGAFTMGNSVAADTDITDAAPVSTTVSAFYMDVNEVTLSQWQSVSYWATSNGYTFAAGAGKGPNHPVQTVSWYDVVKWCNARSEQAGRTPVYYTDDTQMTIYKTGNVNVTNAQAKWTANGYRLPTEAEWEKAARGGRSGQRFPWGDTITQNLANYSGATASFTYDLGPNAFNAIGSVGGTSPATSPVGSFALNGYGLNDMAGNVWEWCWDRYGTPYAGGTDSRGPTTGSNRVVRGGSWNGGADNARCANRSTLNPTNAFTSGIIGFRAVLPPGQ